jgi:hypothetical protein
MKYIITAIVEANSNVEAWGKFLRRDFEYDHPMHDQIIPLDRLNLLEEETHYEPFESSDEEMRAMMYMHGF